MEPVIRNFKSLTLPEGRGAKLIGLEDQSPTTNVTFFEDRPDGKSVVHVHPWEHMVYIIKGSSTLVSDDKKYPIKEGDAIYIPSNVNHYFLNNGGQGVVRRIMINALVAAQRHGPGDTKAMKGTGEPPIIRKYQDLRARITSPLVTKNATVNYSVVYGELAPGGVSQPKSGGHTHSWEHVVYIIGGEGKLTCGGKEYEVSEGDSILIPSDIHHQWINGPKEVFKRLTINPLVPGASDG